jgi:hypothetical protein
MPKLADAEARDAQSAQARSKTISRGSRWCCARHRYGQMDGSGHSLAQALSAVVIGFLVVVETQQWEVSPSSLLCSGVGQTISRRIGQGPRINEGMLLEMERDKPSSLPTAMVCRGLVEEHASSAGASQ